MARRLHSRPTVKRTGENGDSNLLAPDSDPACLLPASSLTGRGLTGCVRAVRPSRSRACAHCHPGWCVGIIKESNGDRRIKIDGEVVNFWVYYHIDDDTSKHVLTLDAYGGDGVGSWALLGGGAVRDGVYGGCA